MVDGVAEVGRLEAHHERSTFHRYLATDGVDARVWPGPAGADREFEVDHVSLRERAGDLDLARLHGTAFVADHE